MSARLQIRNIILESYPADWRHRKRTDKSGLDLGRIPPNTVCEKVEINLLDWGRPMVHQVLRVEAIIAGKIRAAVDQAYELLGHLIKGLSRRNVGYGEGELTAISLCDCRLQKTAEDGITGELKIAEPVSDSI